MLQKYIFGSDARSKMLTGVNKLADAVKVTLDLKEEMLLWTNLLVHQNYQRRCKCC